MSCRGVRLRSSHAARSCDWTLSLPSGSITALDAVFDAMRTDGRLHAISNAHFGPGRDVGYATGSAP